MRVRGLVNRMPAPVQDLLRRAERLVLPLRWRVAVKASAVLPGLPTRVRPAAVTVVRLLWGNPSYSAGAGLCRRVAAEAPSARFVVETGGGLTTLLLRRLLPTDARLVTLEHDASWAEVMTSVLPGRSQAELRVAPLVAVAPGVWWYDTDRAELTGADLLLCDGPPGDTTEGGRRGLVTLLELPGAPLTVIIDDVQRADERHLAEEVHTRWGIGDLEVAAERAKAFAVVAVRARPAP